MRPIKELSRRHGYGSRGTHISGPPWSNGLSMVIRSLLNEHFHEFGFMSVFS